MKVDKKKLAKQAAFLAVFGVTGLAAMLAVKYYKALKSFDDIDWDNLKL